MTPESLLPNPVVKDGIEKKNPRLYDLIQQVYSRLSPNAASENRHVLFNFPLEVFAAELIAPRHSGCSDS